MTKLGAGLVVGDAVSVPLPSNEGGKLGTVKGPKTVVAVEEAFRAGLRLLRFDDGSRMLVRDAVDYEVN